MTDPKPPVYDAPDTGLLARIEWALFGTTDGDLTEDDAELPVGELRRLLRTVVPETGQARSNRLLADMLARKERDLIEMSEEVDRLRNAGAVPDTGQARKPDGATIARAFPAAEALAEAWWAPRHPGVGWADLPATVRDDYVQTAREWINAAQAVAGPSTDTVQAPDVAAERQARYQETACARRPAEERPDA